ncbi:putative derlin-2-like protein [Diplonema papillatum]|nr:putative derlin-2-like protein [Diplonema papillatum]
MSDFRSWYFGVPVVTRCYVTACVAMAVLVSVGAVPPALFVLDGWWRGELWRVVTSSVFSGPVGLGLLFHCYIFVRSSQQVELLVFGRDPVAYTWFLTVSVLLLVPVCHLLSVSLPSSCVIPLLVFISCRSQPNANVSFMFSITVRALYFPLVLLGFSFLMGSSLVPGILGITAGHLYFYHVWMKHPEGTFLPFAALYREPKFVRDARKESEKQKFGTGPLPWGREVDTQNRCSVS